MDKVLLASFMSCERRSETLQKKKQAMESKIKIYKLVLGDNEEIVKRQKEIDFVELQLKMVKLEKIIYTSIGTILKTKTKNESLMSQFTQKYREFALEYIEFVQELANEGDYLEQCNKIKEQVEYIETICSS